MISDKCRTFANEVYKKIKFGFLDLALLIEVFHHHDKT